MLKKKTILDSEITNESYESILQEILNLARARKSAYVCIANVHMVIEAYLDKNFNQVLKQATIVTADGKPLSIFMNLLYGTKQERVAGPDLMLDLIEKANIEGLSVFFYGSTEEVLNTIRLKLAEKYPSLKIAGMISPPFRALSGEEEQNITEEINRSGAHLVLVALGCPKQERWMQKNQGKIQAVMLGVGAAFPFFSGHLKRCPKWLQDLSLEWLYRLLSEPIRLFKRYFITNSLFLLLITRQFLRIKVPMISFLLR